MRIVDPLQVRAPAVPLAFGALRKLTGLFFLICCWGWKLGPHVHHTVELHPSTRVWLLPPGFLSIFMTLGMTVLLLSAN